MKGLRVCLLRRREHEKPGGQQNACAGGLAAKAGKPSRHGKCDEQVQRQQQRGKAQQRPCKAQRARLGIAEQAGRHWPVHDQDRALSRASIQRAGSGGALIEPRRVGFGRLDRAEICGLQRRGIWPGRRQAAIAIQRQQGGVGAFGIIDGFAPARGNRAAQHL